jgi:glycosyltransferase involved in cell wall biosynthesis
MKITVILCTYNRCQSLARALESVAASEFRETVAWEVLVIDNNSKDQTREVVESFCQRYPGRFRYEMEARQGKSFALNTGIREAKGSILAFMDDDVIVAPAWLPNLTAPLDSSEWAGTGGRILAQKMFSVPEWLSLEGQYSLGGMLALFDLGERAEELKCPPYGTNMAFHKSVFEKYGGFRTDLGPAPGSEIRHEDTEFGNRLFAAGERLWYEPSAVVYHAVPENRLTKQFFLQFWFDYGRAHIRENANRADIWGLPRWCFSIPMILMIPLPIKTTMWLLQREPKQRFFFKGAVWMMMGQIVELPRIWLEERKRKKTASAQSGKVERQNVTPV